MKKNKGLEIDNLKELWKQDQTLTHKYSQAELVLMLNKRSINNVKFIVIISFIEFVVIFLSLFITSVDKDVFYGLDTETQQTYLRNAKISQYLSYSNVVISFIFIISFYKSYKKINVLNSTKELIKSILIFRRTVNIFIITNIIIGIAIVFLTGFYSFVSGFRRGFNLMNSHNVEIGKISAPLSSPEYMFFFVLICLLLIIFIAVYYLLVYGIILKRLRKNLVELQKNGN